MARIVLLADDSVTAQNMGRRILMDAGYEVVTVNNGSAALKKIHESRPDLIVLDVYMPGYGGLEVCQRLKESSETSRIPVLLTVGKMEPFKSDEAKRVRADGHIVKPFEASELLAALTRLEDRIVPRPDVSRGKKSKSEKPEKTENKAEIKPEKKAKTWRGPSDPIVSFDDAQTEQIAYLAEVKKRHATAPTAEETSTKASDEGISAAPAPVTVSAEADPTPPKVEETVVVANADVVTPTPASEFAVQESALPSDEAAEDQIHPHVPAGIYLAQQDAPQTELAKNEPPKSDLARDADAPVAEAVAPAAEASQAEAPAVSEHIADEVKTETKAAEPEIESKSAQAETSHAPEAVADPGIEQPVAPVAAEAISEPPAIEASAVAAEPASRWMAESVAVSSEEAAIALDQEMMEFHAASKAAIDATSEAIVSASSENESAAVVAQQADSAAHESPSESSGATFAAAAAAASSSARSVTARSMPVEDSSEAPVAAETVAAWQNWQQIRDSVMGAQQTAQIAESIAQVAQESVAATSAKNSPTPDSPENSSASSQEPTVESADSDALSSIVDSVLAELKPRLMQEIAKKLKK